MKTKEPYQLTLRPFRHMLKSVGAERVSHEAVKEFKDLIESIAIEVAKLIVKVSKHSRGLTVKARDVEFVKPYIHMIVREMYGKEWRKPPK